MPLLDVALGVIIVMLVIVLWAGTLKLAAWLGNRAYVRDHEKTKSDSSSIRPLDSGKQTSRTTVVRVDRENGDQLNWI